MELIIVYHNLIYDKIEEYKKRHGATRTWIANKAGLSRQTLSSMEKTDNPNIQSLLRLAYALECEVTDLFVFDFYTTED